ncbi:protein of unknown function (plasmid) [Cupriavidus taiwanensis]|uniref:Uncharacterized protein n=1 Tax=Cupriavidus taiwanensis TaxID=164546 RepID=A0A375EE03_9BURK|nr:protein of unknown function [Cupriavidus taiwanensis]SOZ74684.1 protein of unknown function [Cupriavidus taiwanensis]SPD49198.1 protein of unknown function [Cupriavidus taiwanensis]
MYVSPNNASFIAPDFPVGRFFNVCVRVYDAALDGITDTLVPTPLMENQTRNR